MIRKLDKEKLKLAYEGVIDRLGDICRPILMLSIGIFVGRSQNYNHIDLQILLTGSSLLFLSYVILRWGPDLIENPFKKKEDDDHAG